MIISDIVLEHGLGLSEADRERMEPEERKWACLQGKDRAIIRKGRDGRQDEQGDIQGV
jgi:hypothetical protein